MFSRIRTIVSSRMTTIIDRFEDPRETLNHTYEESREELNRVKKGIVDLVAAKYELLQRREEQFSEVSKCEMQAGRALDASREDLATLALSRKLEATSLLSSLDEDIANLEREQANLCSTEMQLSRRLLQFHTEKEILKANYSAAEAQANVSQMLSGLSGGFSAVSRNVDRMKARTITNRSKSLAVGELMQAGMLSDFTGSFTDPIDRELNIATHNFDVMSELDALKLSRNQNINPPDPASNIVDLSVIG